MATSLLTSFQCCAYQSSFDNRTGALSVSRSFPYSIAISSSSVMLLPRGSYTGGINSRPAKTKTIAIRATISDNDPNESDKEDSDQLAPDAKSNDNKEDKFRKDLERIVGKDDSGFSGLDLATLIRNKYGRSYDVTLIKKEFMGRNLLAMNVMWKYREQRSFPLTEEEYLLRLDDVANNLKCWGAVSHIRNSLAKVKERPRIGKAVSIFIDMDETGERANEWIYR